MKTKLLGALMLCLMLTSCFEEGYDVSNMDLTLKFGSDTLWTPYNCTGDIMLKGFVYPTHTIKFKETPDGVIYYAVYVPDESPIAETGHYDLTMRVAAGSGTLEKTQVWKRNITLGSMPDFMKEDDVVLDVENPMVFVTTQNESPCDVRTCFTIRTYDAQGNLIKECTTDEVAFAANKTQRICLAESRPEKWAHEMHGAQYVHCEGLSGLIRKIPHHVEVECGEVTTQTTSPEMEGKYYSMRFRFGIFVPFEFGPDFHLIARGETDSLAFELADYADLQPGEIVVEAKADNDIPLDISVTGHLLDEAGNDIEGLVIDKACVPAKKKDYPILLHMRAAAPFRLNNFMDGSGGAKKLHHMKAEAEMTTGEYPSELILRDSKIRLHHARVGIVGGITINAN